MCCRWCRCRKQKTTFCPKERQRSAKLMCKISLQLRNYQSRSKRQAWTTTSRTKQSTLMVILPMMRTSSAKSSHLWENVNSITLPRSTTTTSSTLQWVNHRLKNIKRRATRFGKRFMKKNVTRYIVVPHTHSHQTAPCVGCSWKPRKVLHIHRHNSFDGMVANSMAVWSGSPPHTQYTSSFGHTPKLTSEHSQELLWRTMSKTSMSLSYWPSRFRDMAAVTWSRSCLGIFMPHHACVVMELPHRSKRLHEIWLNHIPTRKPALPSTRPIAINLHLPAAFIPRSNNSTKSEAHKKKLWSEVQPYHPSPRLNSQDPRNTKYQKVKDTQGWKCRTWSWSRWYQHGVTQDTSGAVDCS